MVENNYQNQVVFITGVASGIGAAQAEAFLREGAKVFGIDIAEQGILKNSYLQKNLSKNFAYIIGDVSKSIDVKQAVLEAVNRFDSIDILLNTAGILDDYKNTLETKEMLWDQILAVNLKGMYLVTNEVLPIFLAKQKGIIINMASIAGLTTGGGGAAYTAAKHGIVGYTKQLSFDFAKKGIRVNAIAPGAIQTPMNAADFAGDGQMANWVAQETPANRWAQAREVADLTLFLASEKASYLHGNIIPIDGGWLIK